MAAASLARPLRPFVYTPLARRFWGAVTYLSPFVLVLIVWQMLAASGRYTINQVPPPALVAEVLWDLVRDGTLGLHISQSLARLALGIATGAGMGIALGIALGMNREAAEFVEPLVTFLNALSGIAWVPLAIVWFGIGPGAVTFILWNSIFFLVLFNTMLGVLSVPPVYRNSILTLGGGRRRVITDVLFPGALPNIVLGLRMGIGFGWRALIAAEMIGATSGLGFMIYNASAYQRSDVIIAGVIVIGVLWTLTDHLLLVPLERWTVERWGLVRRAE